MITTQAPRSPLWRTRTAWALALGLLCTTAMTGFARAQEAEDDTAIDKKILQGVLRGLGLRNGEEATIEYRERSPLVVPNSLSLPPPENGRQAVNDPAWPKDADLERSRRAAEFAKRSGRRERTWEEQGKPLSPEELNAGRGTPRASSADGADPGRPYRPEELGPTSGTIGSILSSMGFGRKEGQDGLVDPTTVKEPERTSLVEPPTGYRKPAPTAPYRMGKSGYEPKEAVRVNSPDTIPGN